MSDLKTSFSRLNPVPRGQATVIRSSVRQHQKAPNNQQSRATSFLPTSSPSTISGRLGHPWVHRNWARTWAKPTPGSLQINLLFTIYAEQASSLSRCKLLLLQKTNAVSLNTNRFGGAERDRTADPLLAKQVLSQLSYSPISSIARAFAQVRQLSASHRPFPTRIRNMQMVGPGRLELPTPRLSSVCSNQLSYGPILVKPVQLLDKPANWIDAVLCLLEERETWTARLAIPS